MGAGKACETPRCTPRWRTLWGRGRGRATRGRGRPPAATGPASWTHRCTPAPARPTPRRCSSRSHHSPSTTPSPASRDRSSTNSVGEIKFPSTHLCRPAACAGQHGGLYGHSSAAGFAKLDTHGHYVPSLAHPGYPAPHADPGSDQVISSSKPFRRVSSVVLATGIDGLAQVTIRYPETSGAGEAVGGAGGAGGDPFKHATDQSQCVTCGAVITGARYSTVVNCSVLHTVLSRRDSQLCHSCANYSKMNGIRPSSGQVIISILNIWGPRRK